MTKGAAIVEVEIVAVGNMEGVSDAIITFGVHEISAKAADRTMSIPLFFIIANLFCKKLPNSFLGE